MPSLFLPLFEEKSQIFQNEDLQLGQNCVTSKTNDNEYQVNLISSEILSHSVLPLPVTEQCQIKDCQIVQEHDYCCQSCAPVILNLKDEISELERLCSSQKFKLRTLR